MRGDPVVLRREYVLREQLRNGMLSAQPFLRGKQRSGMRFARSAGCGGVSSASRAEAEWPAGATIGATALAARFAALMAFRARHAYNGKTFPMKLLVVICALAAMVSGHAAPLQTFSSDDGAFQFKYSPKLVHCALQRAPNGHGSGWIPADSCISQDELCDDDDAGAITIACFAYPKDELKNKPEFDAAAFFVARLPAGTTPQGCLEPSKNWQVHKTENATIGSVSGRLFHTGDRWMNGRQEGDVYRVFHGGACYQMDTEEATSDDDVHVSATSEEFTKQDQAEVRARLKEPLDSFTFLK